MSTEPKAPPPRVTLGDIAAAIVGEYYFTAHEGAAGVQALEAARVAGVNLEAATMGAKLSPVVVKAHPRLRDVTICVLVLRNAFVVVGTSIPVAPENFDAELGRGYAREDAIRQCWPLMGYALRERLHAETPRTPIWPQVAALALHEGNAGADGGNGRPVAGSNIGAGGAGQTAQRVVSPTPTPTPPEPVPPEPRRASIAEIEAVLNRGDSVTILPSGDVRFGGLDAAPFDRMTIEEHQRAGHQYDAANLRWVLPGLKP